MSFKKLKTVVSLYLALLMALPAHAAGPFIWGADNRAQGLQQNGAVFSNGQPIDYNGLINKIGNNEAVVNTSGWTTYADAAGTTPVDCTGGSPTLTWTRSTSSPLRGSADFLATKDAANRQGEGVAYAFSIDSADVSKSISIAFDVNGSANYAANDMAVYIYDVTNGVLINPASPNIAQSSYRYQTTFVASTSTSYRLCLHVASTNATAYTVQYDNFVVGPNLPALGVPQTDWQDYVPTAGGLGTLSSIEYLQYKRIGDSILLRGRFTIGTVTSSQVFLNLPPGLTIAGASSANVVAGSVLRAVTNSNDQFAQILAEGGLSYLGIGRAQTAPASSSLWVTNPIANASCNSIFTTGDSISFTTELIPIAEWAGSSVYLSQAQPEYVYNTGTWDANDTTSFGYGPQGAAVAGALTAARGKRVRFLTPIQPTDKLIIQFSEDRVRWSDVGAYPGPTAVLVENYTYRGAGANQYGACVYPYNEFEAVATFGLYPNNNSSTYTGTGAAWASGMYWRVVKIPGQVSASAATLPTGMTPSQATALGYYAYRSGVSYNGGISPTVSYTNWTTTRAVFRPYQMSDGSWWLKGMVSGKLSSSSTAAAPTINGVTFKNISDYRQAIASYSGLIGVSSYPNTARINPNTGQLDLFASSTSDIFSFSFDAELESKPTWAY